MLANPVVIPAVANPFVWCFAFIAMWAEIRTEIALLKRLGWGADVWGSLLLTNIMTWIAFLLAMDRLADRVLPLAWAISLLESGVVVVECALVYSSLTLRARAGAGPSVSIVRVFAISVVGNLVSILVSIALPMAFIWVIR